MFDFCQGTPTMTEPVSTAVWRRNMCIGASLLTSEGKDKPSSTQAKKRRRAAYSKYIIWHYRFTPIYDFSSALPEERAALQTSGSSPRDRSSLWEM